MIYKQNYPRTPPYLGMNLSVRGRKIFRGRARSTKSDGKVYISSRKIIKKFTNKSFFKEIRDKSLSNSKTLRPTEFIKAEVLGDSLASRTLPKLLSPDVYSGPVIEDLIEELHKTSKFHNSFQKSSSFYNLYFTYIFL